ncbi:MAG: mannitol dehydrogenase family protein [Saprospiraceae bacterium]|nr:mannitol dehydrogenase family protein [Saprospiraceae bacterium]
MDFLRLNQSNLPDIAARLSCPRYDRDAVKTGIVHIGVGGFHRSHQAYYIHQLLEKHKAVNWGICGIGLREADRKINDTLEVQNCLYTLLTQHPNGTVDSQVIGSLTAFILAVDHPAMAIDKMAHPDTRIVSLTITEGGYNFNPSTGEFDFDNPAIQHELEHPDQPKTVFGFLAAALQKRREKGLPAFTILSCDNIQHNGAVARKMLLAFVQKQNASLAEWIEMEVRFPNTMVDRITPVTTATEIRYLKEKYNIQDDWPVVCEPFIQWVIEDNFSNGRPPLEKLGVQFVPDVTPYEKMKIRLLNAGHSVLGIPGAIHGHPTIDACMQDSVFATFMRKFMDKEATPVLGAIQGIDLAAYKDSLEERFANPNIKDALSRICSESSAKLPKFLIPTLLENLANEGSIKYGTFILAAWCYYSDRGVDISNTPIKIIDERKEELHQHAKRYKQDNLSFLRISDIFGRLLEHERFQKEYTKVLAAIYAEPDVRKHMKEIGQID